jgi:hypothetical protein
VIPWHDVSLLGIDVGFAKDRKTTGVASYRYGQPVDLHCIGSLPSHRAEVLRDAMVYDAIAIDGPIVPPAFGLAARSCEQILSRGAFGKRCKAGYSHFGTGLQLRNAAAVIAAELPKHRRLPSAPVVEAFPNAFLGVMLDDAAYASFGTPIARGTKSDIFFAQAQRDGCFDRLLQHLDWHDTLLRDTIASIASIATTTTRAAHEHRAALVCVLTAGCALSGQATVIGDDAGGKICLPPRLLWAEWARDSLN